MDGATLNYLPWASLGVGGVLAAVIFWFYRRDFLRERDAATAQRVQSREDRLIEHAGRKDERQEAEQREEQLEGRASHREDRLLEVLSENTKALVRLTSAIEGLERAVRDRWLRPSGEGSSAG